MSHARVHVDPTALALASASGIQLLTFGEISTTISKVATLHFFMCMHAFYMCECNVCRWETHQGRACTRP